MSIADNIYKAAEEKQIKTFDGWNTGTVALSDLKDICNDAKGVSAEELIDYLEVIRQDFATAQDWTSEHIASNILQQLKRKSTKAQS